jgi:hypothetical protein
LAVICKTCYTRGDINATVSLQNLVPALSLSLTDIEAYLDLEVRLGLATTIAVNLFTPVAPIELSLAGLKVSAMVYLDLVLGVDAAIDFTGGIWVKIAEKALLETNILSGELLKTDFSGLSVKTLPIEVQIGCASLQADLRLRVQLVAEADVDLGSVLDLGAILPLPDIGAGVELGVYANLVEYVGLLCDTPSCPVSKESYGLNVGVAVGLDIEVEDILTLDLAPTVSIGLLTLPTVTICEQGQRPTHSASASVTVTGGVVGASVSATATGGKAGASASGKSTGRVGGGYPSGKLPSGSAGLFPTGKSAGGVIGASAYSTATGTYAVSVPVITSSAAAGSDYGSGSGLVTSTVKATTIYTITRCAASVANCPASYASEQTIVKTVDVYTTVCPATVSLTAPASIKTTFPASSYVGPSAVTTVTTDSTLLVPCSEVETFTPPTGVATVPVKTTSSVYATTTATGSYSHSHSSSSGQASETYPVSSSTAATESYPVSYPVASETYLVSSSTAASESYPVSYPVGSKSETSAAPYPTYPVISKGYNNTSVYLETSVYSKPSASVYYQASSTYAASGYPTATPVTASAGKIGSVGFAAALGMAGALIAMI